MPQSFLSKQKLFFKKNALKTNFNHLLLQPIIMDKRLETTLFLSQSFQEKPL
jgi:hypothetical protein